MDVPQILGKVQTHLSEAARLARCLNTDAYDPGPAIEIQNYIEPGIFHVRDASCPIPECTSWDLTIDGIEHGSFEPGVTARSRHVGPGSHTIRLTRRAEDAEIDYAERTATMPCESCGQ